MSKEALLAHLATGTTTVCRAWILRRRDGRVLGFTDHDTDLALQGIICRADTGMTARALQQTTGLSVDNSEAFGALSATAITEADLAAGRYDGAEVQAFLVNWSNPDEHMLQFRGQLGEISRVDGSFRAELRGLTDLLNRPHGMAYTPGCSAVLGDSRCKFDLTRAGYSVLAAVEAATDGQIFLFRGLGSFEDRWFESGLFTVISGAGQALSGAIKIDRTAGSLRRIELWQSLRAVVSPGDTVRIAAGCDKSALTCRAKFDNFLNFRGFPHIPGDDWLASYPVSGRTNGGRRRLAGGGT